MTGKYFVWKGWLINPKAFSEETRCVGNKHINTLILIFVLPHKGEFAEAIADCVGFVGFVLLFLLLDLGSTLPEKINQNTEYIIRSTHLWGFMSQPTSVHKTLILFVHEDRKLNFSSNCSPAKDVDEHEVPKPIAVLFYYFYDESLENRVREINWWLFIGQKQVKLKLLVVQLRIFYKEWIWTEHKKKILWTACEENCNIKLRT